MSAFAMRDALGDNARSILVSSAVLSEKEREIQRMIARIQELEQRKRTQPSTSTRGTVGDTVDEPTTAVLGKRTGSVCEEAIQSAGSTTKVRMRFHIARRSRTTYAAATKNGECCSTQHKSEHVQCTWNTFLHCVIRLTNFHYRLQDGFAISFVGHSAMIRRMPSDSAGPLANIAYA